MPVVSAYLVPGSPLPYMCKDNPPWRPLVEAFHTVGEQIAASSPDTLVIYSTQWIAVLDQLWLAREHATGVHVDENWHEYGELPFDLRTDRELVAHVIAATPAENIRSKGVDYDGFPVDTGTIVATSFLDPYHERAVCVTSNNVYHDWDITMSLGRVARQQADQLGRRISVIGVGGLSGSFFRDAIDIATDHIASTADDEWNQTMLKLLEQGDVAGLHARLPDYVAEARVDMGFKQLAFVLGTLNGEYRHATTHAYGPIYGTGAAIVELVA